MLLSTFIGKLQEQLENIQDSGFADANIAFEDTEYQMYFPKESSRVSRLTGQNPNVIVGLK